MKKLFFILAFLGSMGLVVNAGENSSLPFTDIKNKDKIIYNQDLDKWSDKVSRKSENYYTKIVYEGDDKYHEFYNADGVFAFATDCDYEFLNDGKLIGYSNENLKFYTFAILDNKLVKQELDADSIQNLFPNYKIIKISEFNPNTNSMKISRKNKKLLILNDTEINFADYVFSSNNVKFDTYKLNGLIDVQKRGMLLFSHDGQNSKDYPWFVILIR